MITLDGNEYRRGEDRCWRTAHLDGEWEASLEMSEALDEIERLSKIVDSLAWLNDNSYDLRSVSVPTGGDDYDVEWVVISHHMDKPREREIGRGRSAQAALRIAAEKARTT